MRSSITSHSYLSSSASQSCASLSKSLSSLIANVSYVKRYSLVSMYSFAVISDAMTMAVISVTFISCSESVS